jgi:hypothetical protein
MNDESFGRRALARPDCDALLEMESAESRTQGFAAIDTAIAGLAIRAARGDRILRISRTELGDMLEIVGVPDALQAEMRSAFELESQQARGAWFLPEKVSIRATGVLFAATFRESPRFVHTLAGEEKAKVALSRSPDAMVVWSVLEPLFDEILGPVFLRVEELGLLGREDFLLRWSEMAETFAAIGLSAENELAPFAWGRGWGRLTGEQQLEAKQNLLTKVAEEITIGLIRRRRAWTVGKLIAQYYAKAKKGRAKRKQVITKDYARVLAGYFGGDWLRFVAYLGEQPHEEERVVTALPETKLMVSGKSKAAEIASKKGIPLEEAERILTEYWRQAGGESPIVERSKVLTEYWKAFDAIHARQARGMAPLWGLVEEGGWPGLEPQSGTTYQDQLYGRVLPSDIVQPVERLWGTTVLAKWPDRIVSEPYPHTAMAASLGPALKFWHGCALTAWFVCEGPTSRTDIPGLADYYSRELAELAAKGFPIQAELFAELGAVKLGPEEPIYESSEPVDLSHGFSGSIQTSMGSRRSGFELLRDVITRHRRWWSTHRFEAYLRDRWESELKVAGRAWHLMSEEKGKTPTLKQFAKHAVEPARRWFGGDVSLLLAALGQKMPGGGTTQAIRMPRDRVRFARSVFDELGGKPFDRRTFVESREDADRQAAEQDTHHKLWRLAGESLWYVQLLEALDRPPTLKEFGSKFEWIGTALSENQDMAWNAFASAIERCLARALA